MPDIAGAKAAIVARFETEWADRTPIAKANENPPALTDDSGNPLPWVFIEVVPVDSWLEGFGASIHPYQYPGIVNIYCLVPQGTGTEIADANAVAAGEIFRMKRFYTDANGGEVRTWAPRLLPGGDAKTSMPGSSLPDGNWWAVLASIPFGYRHIG